MSTSRSKSTVTKAVTHNKKVQATTVSNKSAFATQRSYARFDARLPQEVKDLFERAASIKGFKSLSEFVIYYTSEAAHIIIEKHNQILASERDKNIFFDALVNAPKPNKTLSEASKRYKVQVAAQ